MKSAQRNAWPSNIFPYEKEPSYGPMHVLVSAAYLRQHRDELESGKESWE